MALMVWDTGTAGASSFCGRVSGGPVSFAPPSSLFEECPVSPLFYESCRCHVHDVDAPVPSPPEMCAVFWNQVPNKGTSGSQCSWMFAEVPNTVPMFLGCVATGRLGRAVSNRLSGEVAIYGLQHLLA